MNEVDEHRKKQRGIRAQQLLDDELIKQAFDAIRNNVFDKFTSSSFKDQETREDCYRMLRAAESFEGMFKRYIREGRIAEEKLSFGQKVVKRIQEL